VRLAYALFILFALVACGKKPIVELNKTFDSGWVIQDTVSFEFNFSDSVSGYNMFFELEHGPDYPYSNFFLFTDNWTPSGNYYRDTIECYLAKPDGEWLGNSSRSTVRHKVLFKKNIRFPEGGMYRMKWVHGMRDTTLTDVKEIGFIIEKEA
jgi:gliding motility-associated lipoprotein GldH